MFQQTKKYSFNAVICYFPDVLSSVLHMTANIGTDRHRRTDPVTAGAMPLAEPKQQTKATFSLDKIALIQQC